MHKKSDKQRQQWKAFRRNLGKNIKAVRQAQGLSLDQLSEMTGHSVLTLSRWEGTRVNLELYEIFYLAQVLKIPPVMLLK